MIIFIGDWSFDVDTQNTEAYTKRITDDHCTCGYCRNFYASVDAVSPNLRPFLAQFCLDVEGPVEMMPFEPTVCQLTYCASGTIVSRGSMPIVVDGMVLDVIEGENLDIDIQCPKPRFAFMTGYMELPWVLDEDMDEVISPANEPECLQRMWGKLLENADNCDIIS